MTTATLDGTLNLARSQINTVESPPSSNNQKYGIWYNFNRVPWCAIFVSWVLAHSGSTSGYRFASVAFSLDWARKNGRHTGEFRAGYICCRINDGSWWGPGHTGIIEAVHSDGTVTSIEGNTSPGSAGSQRDGGGVYRRRRPRSYWNRQCIRIDYGSAPAPTPGPTPAPTPAPAPSAPAFPGRILRYPPIMSGGDVRTWQQKMKDRGWRIDADGAYGPQSKDVCTKFQREKGLGVDGQVGPQTWNATWTARVT